MPKEQIRSGPCGHRALTYTTIPTVQSSLTTLASESLANFSGGNDSPVRLRRVSVPRSHLTKIFLKRSNIIRSNQLPLRRTTLFRRLPVASSAEPARLFLAMLECSGSSNGGLVVEARSAIPLRSRLIRCTSPGEFLTAYDELKIKPRQRIGCSSWPKNAAAWPSRYSCRRTPFVVSRTCSGYAKIRNCALSLIAPVYRGLCMRHCPSRHTAQ